MVRSNKPRPGYDLLEIGKDRIKKMYDQGQNDCEIAGEVGEAGVTSAAVRLWRKRRGLPPNRRRRARAYWHQQALRMYRRGLLTETIAAKLGKNIHTTRVALWRALHKGRRR